MVITELLCYQSLLETQRPYLVNIVRIPALQACLLFSKKIDTNLDLTKMVIDDWLLLTFMNNKEAEKALILANWLRLGWEHTINTKLEKLLLKQNEQQSFKFDENFDELLEDYSEYELPAFVKRIRKDWEEIQCNKNLKDDEQSSIEADDVTRLLIEFMNMTVDCKVTKPSSNELSAMFPFVNEEENVNGNQENKNKKKNLPGLLITPYLRYGSLPLNAKVVKRSKSKNKNNNKESTVHLFGDRKFYSPPDPYMKQYWKCGWCNKFEGVLERPEAIEHLNHCSFYQENLIHIQQLKKKKKHGTAITATTTTITMSNPTNSTNPTNPIKEKETAIEASMDHHNDSTLSNNKHLSSKESSSSSTTTNEKVYFCKKCNQEIIIKTPADILRHRKNCQGT